MRTAVLLIALALPALARGQPAPARPAPPGTPALTAAGAFFALSVADLDGAARWYAEKLGLAVVMREPRQHGAAVAVLEGGGLVVELVARDGAVPLGTAAPGREALDVHGIFKAGVVVADYDRALATLRARGVPIVIGPFPATATRRANLVFRDGAGNLIQLLGGYAGPPR